MLSSLVYVLLFASTLASPTSRSTESHYDGIDVLRTKDCPPDSVLVGKACVSTDVVQPSLVCPPATVSLNGDCVSFSRASRVCPTGFSPYLNRCVQVERLPASLVCERGQLVQSGSCRMETEVPPVCPLGFELLNDGQCVRFASPSFSCPPDFEKLGQECVKRVSTEAAAECPPDFDLDSDGCTKSVPFPPSCAEGFSLVGAECVGKAAKVNAACPDGSEPAGRFCVKRETSPVILVCPPDFELNAEDVCVQEVAVPPSCPAGSVDLLTGQCEHRVSKQAVCEDSEVLVGRLCRSSAESPADLICPDGYTLMHNKCKNVRIEDAVPMCSIGVLEGDQCAVHSTTTPRLKCPAGYDIDKSHRCVRDVTFDCSKPAVKVECSMPAFVADLAAPAASLRSLIAADYKAKRLPSLHKLPISNAEDSKLPDCSPVEYIVEQTCVKVEAVPVEKICPDGSEPVGKSCKTVSTRAAELKCRRGNFDRATGNCITIVVISAKVVCSSAGVLQPGGVLCLSVSEREATWVCPAESVLEHGQCIVYNSQIQHPNRVVRQIPQVVCDVGELEGKVCVEVEKTPRDQICPVESEERDGACVVTRPPIIRPPVVVTRPVVDVCPYGTVLSAKSCIKAEETPAEPFCPPDSVFDEFGCRFTAELQYLPPRVSFYPARSVCPEGFKQQQRGRECSRTTAAVPELQCAPGFIRFKSGYQECLRLYEAVPVCPAGTVRQGSNCVRKTYTPPRITEVKICTKGQPGC